jgi:assimilatory nitrate reductase catalytic subunit
MGGREVGGLANQLAATMTFAPQDVDRVRRFWNARAIAERTGLKAVDMFKAVADGRIKAIWIAATNPAASMPMRTTFAARSRIAPSSSCRMPGPPTPVPALTSFFPRGRGPRRMALSTNSERRISRQRAFRAPPGAARPDWWMFTEVAHRMGWADAFAYDNPAAIFREHAALSAFENNGARVFDIGALANVGDEAYDALEPVQWPCANAASAAMPRLFADGGFPDAGRTRAHDRHLRHLQPRTRRAFR